MTALILHNIAIDLRMPEDETDDLYDDVDVDNVANGDNLTGSEFRDTIAYNFF